MLPLRLEESRMDYRSFIGKKEKHDVKKNNGRGSKVVE